MFYRFRDALAA